MKSKMKKTQRSRKTRNPFVLPIIVEEDDGGYFATCPSLQGCYTQGKSYQEVLDNLEDVVRLHIQDRLANGEVVVRRRCSSGATLEILL